ncbi:hypothetical protein NLU13_8283 [Sarocladium strictum]|uniref:N-acetyltransferase domain-containing protein n=1 Tax=Sarocladium strictum TaxID=5046 RepID=A0AA39GBE6_SARSR|nr:hypothetical protein NLU13_8283 [Sarocladium strictum]
MLYKNIVPGIDNILHPQVACIMSTMFSKPASECSWAELAKLVNKSFEGYIGSPVHMTAEGVEAWFPANFVAPAISPVFFPSSPEDGAEPIAFALLSVRDDRPGQTRLTTMGVVPTFQGRGTGSKVLQEVIEAERKRGTRLLELECIQGNERALKLYTRNGFTKYRELAGWHMTEVPSEASVAHPGLQDCSVEDVDAILAAHGSPDLPWQARGMAKLASPGLGFRLDHAYCVIEKPNDDADTILVYCFIVEPDWRRKGEGKRLIEALVARYPGKKFKARPIFPYEYGESFTKSLENLRIETIGIKLWQMRLDLA